jgi:PTH1 family peptidyl-tRNA hydrolase
MYLFVGLGNPGAEYAKHRHNIGFMAVDAIADTHGFSNWKEKSKGLYSEGKFGTQKVFLLKPQTFMNLSGESLQPLAAFYKIPPENIFVFHDELDLAAGVIKVKKGGGSAGHNGLKSITERLGTPDYYRVRMGIGHPGSKARVNGHVLGNFNDEDYIWLEPLLKNLAKFAPDLLLSPNDFTSKVTQELKPIFAKNDAKSKS